MVVFAVGVLVGAFVGWNLPQPKWAADIQFQIMQWFHTKQ